MPRHYPPSSVQLFGYDPERDLPPDHLVRLVEEVVELALPPGPPTPPQPGQPAWDRRLVAKVLLYAYATGVRSSRQMEQLCRESLPYLLLTRGAAPSYRVFCSFRVEQPEALEAAWLSLFAVAKQAGMARLGRVVVDSSVLRANASKELVLEAKEYARLKEELARALAEAEEIDAREAQAGPPPGSGGKPLPRCQMRDIVRQVRKALGGEPTPPGPTRMSAKMQARVHQALAAIEEAEQEGRKHLCLTDPEARMMHGGRDKHVREGYSLEVVLDQGAGLLVAHGTKTHGQDNDRLLPLLKAARKQLPEGIAAVDADSGYYFTPALRQLLEEGVDVCVPDSATAGALHRGLVPGATIPPERAMTYLPERDAYRCGQGNLLVSRHTRDSGRGHLATRYRAERCCRDCPQAEGCFAPWAQHRERKLLVRRTDPQPLEASLARFGEPAHRQRYRQRGRWIEGVFGWLKGPFGYGRWWLRGEARVRAEGTLLGLAYQLRTVHKRWAPQHA